MAGLQDTFVDVECKRGVSIAQHLFRAVNNRGASLPSWFAVAPRSALAHELHMRANE